MKKKNEDSPVKSKRPLISATLGILCLPFLVPLTLIELVILSATVKNKKTVSENGNFNDILKKLTEGESVTPEDWEVAERLVRGIRDVYGSSTFDFQSALRVLLTAKEKREDNEPDAQRWQVPSVYENKIKQAFTGYRFFMTMPCADNGVLWSENLQILHATAEYFTAILWPQAVFSRDGKPASEHKDHAEKRIRIWLEQRWFYGFAEWNSPTYYVEDISPLSLIIDFAEDEALRQQAKIILDLLLYDLAVGQYGGIFGSSSGRCYPKGRRIAAVEDYNGKAPLELYNAVGCVIREMAGDGIYDTLTSSPTIDFIPGKSNGMLNNFKYRKKDGYVIPEVFKRIAKDNAYREFKASYGLTLSELKDKNLIGFEDRQIMMQWAMESFSNPETVENTIAYCREYKLFGNGNFKQLRFFNLTVLRVFGAMPLLTKVLNPFTNGIALERANVYTYRTPHYLQSTAQGYKPRTHGNQQHVWTVIFGVFSVFVSNPLGSPHNQKYFWQSDGVIPSVAQEKTVTMSIYDTRIKGIKLRKIYRYSHAHFPASLFDETVEERLCDGMIFGNKNGAFIALIADGPLKFVNANGDEDASFGRHNLVRKGKITAWICETSDSDKETFEGFVLRIASNPKTFNKERLTYRTNGKAYVLENGGLFYMDNKPTDFEYERYESDFVLAKRESDAMAFKYDEATLNLDFFGNIREHTCSESFTQ